MQVGGEAVGPARRRGLVAAGSALVVLFVLGASLVLSRITGGDDEAGPGPLKAIRSLAVIGDSYSRGTPIGGQGSKGWPALVAKHYGASLDLTAVSGRGYLNPGLLKPGHTYPEQAREVVSSWHGDVLIVFGSRNDSSRRFAPRVEQVAKKTLTYLVNHLPHTRIVVIGPTWPAQFPPGGDPEANRAAVREAARLVPGIVYVDPMQEPWFSARNGSLIGRDNSHFTDAGHRYLSEKIIEVLDRRVLGA